MRQEVSEGNTRALNGFGGEGESTRSSEVHPSAFEACELVPCASTSRLHAYTANLSDDRCESEKSAQYIDSRSLV